MKSWLLTCPSYCMYFCLNSKVAWTLRNAQMSQKPLFTFLQDQKGLKQHLSSPDFKHNSVIHPM